MSAKAIYEAQGKALLARELLGSAVTNAITSGDAENTSSLTSTDLTPLFRIPPAQVAHLQFAKEAGPLTKAVVYQALDALPLQHPWLLTSKLVVKPDQLIKRRGKAGLLGLNLNWEAAKAWIAERAGQIIKVGDVTGVLKTFILEPFVPHPQETEHYLCIQSVQDGDLIYFYHAGGIDVGDVDAKAKKWLVPIETKTLSPAEIEKQLLPELPVHARQAIADFIRRLWHLFAINNFTYLEINPLVLLPAERAGDVPQVIFLDLAAKLDQTAEFELGKYWGTDIEFPAPFGRDLSKEEQYIQDLDAKTGASLKLTILNRQGRIWTMVAGGGASVVYSDAIAAHGFAHELANYGEYSGAPSETQTYEYAKTLLDLMTTGAPRSDGKVLIVGGGIANFTNVAATFKGIVRSLREYQTRLKEHKVEIYVRRGGPNYQEGLKLMRKLGETLKLPIHVFGPETHITAIVPLALGITGPSNEQVVSETSFAESMFMGGTATTPSINAKATPGHLAAKVSIVDSPTHEVKRFEHDLPPATHPWYSLFTKQTRSFVWGMQPRAVQGMLDFDHMCGRTIPSVAAIIYPFGGSHVQKFYWGAQETLLPVFTSFSEAMAKCADVDVVVNFASCRSVYSSCKDILETAKGKIKTIAVIAEGVPERRTKELAVIAKVHNVNIIGPATVGGIKPGCFKIGNTGGMIDNIVSCRLYRPGSVSYVSKSGGMSNELNNMLSRCTDGVYEGVAIGGDRYPCTTFLDHIKRFEQDPACQLIVLLGEVGGTEEYKVAEAIKNGTIKKPVVAWCIGTCAGMFGSEVQFGHAGALANSDLETSNAKNRGLKEAGALVPSTFEALPALIEQTFKDLVAKKIITIRPEPEAPKVPIDYAWAQELGLIRKPASFVSTICDDRGQELLYAGMPISEVFKEEIGIGGVVSLLWFKRRLPDYACKFIEMVLMLTADHGPAVSGAHNTIVTARAGKDLISSLTAGLLTIGDRFGGALDGAAEQFSVAFDQGWTPQEFVNNMRKENKLIMGIGHKIKSRTNPDLRVSILTEFAQTHFPQTPLLDYARQVEQITTAKKDNLILNVDGATAVLFVDLLRHCGAFSKEEAEEYVKYGTLNGLFVLGRSIGFIGHYIDQKRLKQGLYRHDWNDISYLLPDTNRVVISEQQQ